MSPVSTPSAPFVPSASVAVVLGATGRLSTTIVSVLETTFPRVLRVGRSTIASLDIAGVEVRDQRWWEPQYWVRALRDGDCSPEDVGCVINLVAGRERTTADCQNVGRSGVRATVGLARAVRESRAETVGPMTVHVGSVSESRPGRLRGYAAGKAAARGEALRLGVDVIVTVSVVPRPVGDPADGRIRRVAGSVPSIAAVRVGTSRPTEVAEAVAVLGSADAADLWRESGSVEVTLAAEARQLADVLGVEPRPRWYSSLARAALAWCPGLSRTRWHRVAAFARLARERGTHHNHYLDAVPSQAATPEPLGSLGGFHLAANRADDGVVRRWIIPDRLTTKLDARDGT